MERESFVFYRSFYEALKCMPSEVQAELYPAICEYALFGNLPDNLSEVATGMFALIRPNIDACTVRYKNGKKGGRKRTTATKEPEAKSDGAGTAVAADTSGPAPDTASGAEPAPAYTVPYEQEVEQMRADAELRKDICDEFGISPADYNKRLSRFLVRCNEDKKNKGKKHHDSYEDCVSHLRYWMSKVFPRTNPVAAANKNIVNTPPFPEADYSFKGGFGGMDV